MGINRWKSLLLALLALSLVLTLGAAAQQSSATSDVEERTKAMNLWKEDKYLEALPLFEDLAAKNPNDDKLLLGLASCLITHSATLADADAAGKARARATELLKKAQRLGNHSTLLQNLLQNVQATPATGHMKYSDDPAVDEAMRAAEGAFAHRDFDEAVRLYSHVLELDPKNVAAALFVGDSYFAKRDFANAAEWYGRASKINPDVETPYRYYADMLTKQGDLTAARAMAIRAVVAEPYNPITWRGLAQWADSAHVKLVRVHVEVPDNAAKQDETHLTISVPSGASTNINATWMAYGMAKALWQAEKFKQHFPQETQYRHSLVEEADCLTSAAKVWLELQKKKKMPESVDANLDLLAKIFSAGDLEPYVLLNAADQGIARDYDSYRQKNRQKLEEYLGQFVVPPAPSKP